MVVLFISVLARKRKLYANLQRNQELVIDADELAIIHQIVMRLLTKMVMI
jgi:chromosome condensin MukBEF complex kleisin-like MukF subunit